LHLSPDLEPDNPGRETVALAVLTQRSGWRAIIASAGGHLVNEAERAAVRHKRIQLLTRSAFASLRGRMQVKALIQKERPALLHAHGLTALSYAAPISAADRLPLIADLTQPLADEPKTHRLLQSLKTAPALIRVPSEFMREHLETVFHVEHDRISYVPPGVDLKWFSAGFISPERLSTLSQQWRLPEHASVILVPMPLKAGLGHKVFLEALARLKDENVFAVLAGCDRREPGLRRETEALLKTLHLEGCVIMPEFCTDLPAACWLSSVVVAPNVVPRGQNLELLAAQAIGRPVIVTDIGANREMVLSGETAWVVPPDDAGALAEAIRGAVRLDTEQRLNLAELTHNFIAETFPQYAWFDHMMHLYESLLRPAERTVRSQAAA